MTYLRTDPDRTLSTLIDEVGGSLESTRTLTLEPSKVHVDFLGDTVDLDGREVAIGPRGVGAFADLLDIPTPFLLRQAPDIQQLLVSALLPRSSDAATYAFTDEGITEIREPRVQVISPVRLLNAAARVIDGAAPVRDFWNTSAEFRLDVYAPQDFDRGVGGDPEVGDISSAGLRIFQDRKHNLAPSVQPFQYRFWCTNGATSRHEGLKVDARGMSVEEVLGEFEQMADVAFRQAESEIAALYEMRQVPVSNPEQMLLRLATDASLPDRTITTLISRVPAMVDEAMEQRGRVSMFDLVNLMTNQANDPSQRRSGYRTRLEEAAGSLIIEHAERCSHCQARLVHVH